MSTPDNFAREPLEPCPPPAASTGPLSMANSSSDAHPASPFATDSILPGSPPPVAAAPTAPGSRSTAFSQQLPEVGQQSGSARSALATSFDSRDDSMLISDRNQLIEPGTAPVIRAAPPWLFSLFVHMLFVILAGLLFLPRIVKPRITLEISYDGEAEQLEEVVFEMAPSELEEIVEPVLTPKELAIVEDPLVVPQPLNLAEHAHQAAIEMQVPDIRLALNGRQRGMKEALLTALGGTPGTEAAVRNALEWFKRNQRRDGLWSLMGPYSNGAAIENPVAATAMALLAFQGAGHTHVQGDYVDVVRRGWYALLGNQESDGDFWQSGVQHQRLYSQAQATIALCELYGMTRDEEYREPAQRAVNYAIKIQDEQGGWRYNPGLGSDTSVTGWFVMALQSARMAYLDVDPMALEKITRYLDSAASLSGARYGYLPGDGGTPSMTAEGLLCRQYLGWGREDPRLVSGVEYLGVHPIDYTDRDVYYWYYATQVMHHMDDENWGRWNKLMRVDIPKHQVLRGRERGSWSPAGDRWGSHGGRLYVSALSTFMLEVYYRHLPIYADISRFHGF